VESRFEAMHNTKLPPLFGREEEVDLLFRRWRHATQEEGRVVMLTGEPGIGKSHIARAFDERLQSESHITLRYFCSAHHTNSALFPFISQLERAAGFEAQRLACRRTVQARRSARAIHGGSRTRGVLASLLALPAAMITDCRSWLRKNAKRRLRGVIGSARWVGSTAAGFNHFRRCPMDRPNLA
jgi:Predicted ATPase